MLAEQDIADTGQIPAAAEKVEPVAKPRRRRRLRLGVSTWVYIGVVAAAGGFGLIAFAWSRIAGVLNVGLQLPYLVSAGLSGLGLVIVGVAIAHFAALHRDSLGRIRQMEQVTGLLRSIVDELAAEDEQPEG
jgi:hypothetical protein